MFHFQHIEYLPGLALVVIFVLLFFSLLQWKKTVTRKMGDAGLIAQLTASFSQVKFVTRFVLLVLAFVAIVLGAANLQRKGNVENVSRAGVDVMLVLDVSRSMLAEDVKPSRLEKAKQLMSRLVDRLGSDRVGLVLFAGRAYLQMPLTLDHSAANMFIQDAGPAAVPTQGTVIADALHMANSAFNSKEHKYKAIVLISDGEDHDPQAPKVVKELADEGVMINTVGIGSADGSVIIDPVTHETKKDQNGDVVISKLNEAELKQLSDATNGTYIRLDNIDDALITLTQRLDGIEKRALTDSEFVNYSSYFQWFLAAALALLVTEFFMSERKLNIA